MGNEELPENANERVLFDACISGNVEIVKNLLELGVDASFPRGTDLETPLMMAAQHSHAEIIQTLLEYGVPWQAQDKDGNTAGEYAMHNKAILKILLDWAVRSEMILGHISHKTKKDNPASEEYLKSKLAYQNGKLMDASGEAVMMGWETPLMKRHADVICKSHGSVLNVGFGLGIIDEEIQKRKPLKHHTIIEAHPDVYRYMCSEEGGKWNEREGVTVVFGRWQDVIANLGPFDGIFFDTYGEYYEDMKDFHNELPRLLNPGGIYSFFNGLAPDNLFFHMVYGEIARLELNSLGLSVKYDAVPIESALENDVWEGVKNRYWHLPVYFLPTAILENKK